jgi:hypothetical protein
MKNSAALAAARSGFSRPLAVLLLSGALAASQAAPIHEWRAVVKTPGTVEALAELPGAPIIDVPAPSLRNVPNDGYAQVTLAPWVESNGWRFLRGVGGARYSHLPRGAAGLAAAEGFAFNVDVELLPDPADLDELNRLIAFLHAQSQRPMPALANFGVIDDRSLPLDEALNMLTRRNLLFRLVKQPDPTLAFTVRPGSEEFPRESLRNPNDFAARVREKLGDDRRLVRIFGTNTVIARLTGDTQHVRLVLLSYSRNRQQQDVRIRLLGNYEPTALAAYAAPADARLEDVQHVDGATEFSVPFFNTIAIVDLGTR